MPAEAAEAEEQKAAAPKKPRAPRKPRAAAPAEPAAKTEPKVEKPALVLDFARAVRGALRSKNVTDTEVIRVLDANDHTRKQSRWPLDCRAACPPRWGRRGDRSDRPDDQEVRGLP